VLPHQLQSNQLTYNSKSEFVGLKDVPHAVSTCFKHPFSKEDAEPCADDSQKRNIVLVGHDVQADVKFLRTVGYDVYTLSNLVDTADTSLMWRYLKEENNPRNLATILAELGIEAWHLHNGGNDAVYTLQAMIGIVIKSLAEEQEKKRKEEEIQRCFQRNEE
jgi:DNA polymerase III alpha subunit (gram-positive type)